jgi:hypothetical protein
MARTFNGTSEWVQSLYNIGDNPYSGSASNQLVAFAGWCYPTSATGTQVWVAASNNGNNGIQIYSSNAGDGRVAINFPGGSGVVSFGAGGALTLNVWTHIVIAGYNGQFNWTLWLNGVQAATLNGFMDFTSFDVLTVGAAKAGLNFFSGRAADVAFWENTALFGSDAMALSKGKRPSQVGQRTGFFTWWPLENDTSVATDASGFGNVGTFHGTSYIPGPPQLNAAPVLPLMSSPSFVMQPLVPFVPPAFILMPQIVM